MKTRIVSIVLILMLAVGVAFANIGGGIIGGSAWWRIDSSGALTTDLDVTTTGALTSSTLSGLAPVSDHTANATLTAAQCVGYKHTNQGTSGEVDLTMGASSQGAQVMFENQEAQVIEVGPPSGELLVLDGVALDADDCVDGDGATIGSYMICSRGKLASGTAAWLCTSDGLWSDTGATD